ncbi:MAG: peptidoglycan DD-metalloendopeptidase family protein [Oscillospiraceae bacterium]|nr:peptidoglycan DD-metalloendopeptidase family protein [Oscillospiraceae bacterium]
MKKKRICALLLALLLAFAPAPGLSTAGAVTQGDIDALKKDARAIESQKKELEKELENIQRQKADAIAQRNLLDQQIELTVREIANTESQINGYAALLDQTAYELEVNRQQEAEQYALFCERARVMEEAGSTSYWSVLFKAADFSDLLSRLSDVQEVMNYDQSVLDSLRGIRAQIEAKQAEQEALLAASEEAKAALEAQKLSLDKQREEANDLVKRIQADEAAAAELVKAREAEEAEIQKQIKKKEEELAAQMLAAAMNWSATSGGYIWPETVSKRITSPQGQRNTGIKGASTNHKGVDIGGVGYTTNVLATKAGVVITAERSSSYGNYVVISHGPGNRTLYAHMSSLSVKEGATVTQGQVIGVTGSTGISSGPHLHYEIFENDSRVNPLDYLPGYIKAW